MAKQKNSSRTGKGRKAAVVAALSRVGTITAACQSSEISRGAHYAWMKKDENYAKEVEEAHQEFADRIRHEVIRRAMQGTKRPMMYAGRQCKNEQGEPMWIIEYS